MWATQTPRDLAIQWKIAMTCPRTKLWPLKRLNDHKYIRRSWLGRQIIWAKLSERWIMAKMLQLHHFDCWCGAVFHAVRGKQQARLATTDVLGIKIGVTVKDRQTKRCCTTSNPFHLSRWIFSKHSHPVSFQPFLCKVQYTLYVLARPENFI